MTSVATDSGLPSARIYFTGGVYKGWRQSTVDIANGVPQRTKNSTDTNGPVYTHTDGSATVKAVKSGSGTLSLSGAGTYSGTTTVNGGTLLVSGFTGAGAVTVSMRTHGGNGSVGGPVTVQSGAMLSPGTSAGKLTVNNHVTLNAGSTTLMEISKLPLTNDQLIATGTLNYGGTLTVTNKGGTLVLGDSFQLFSAPFLSGAFALTNLPPLGTGLVWDFDPANGTLSVVLAVATNPTNIIYTVSNSVLTLSWPADHTGWRLQTQTNALAAGLGTNWVDVIDSKATNSIPWPLEMNNGSVFFRLIYP